LQLTGVALVAALVAAAAPARADVSYATSGEDVYRIASAQTSSRVEYAGNQRLAIRRESGAWRFEARAHYARRGPDGKGDADAYFVQVLLRDGTLEDRVDEDPDFLTILNQPFAVRLDKATLRDVRALHGRVPFSATSPLGAEAVLRGYLRPAPGGPVSGVPTVAVRFQADGAMTGPLPGYAETLVAGTMHMDGTAYYSVEDAILMALDVTLTLDARLAQNHSTVSQPVHIVYRRTIKATSKTLPPTRPRAGDGTAAPSTR
jgi:hypothetical protein